MAASKKEFTEEEKAAMKRKGLDWRYYQLVCRCGGTLIVQRIGSEERQLV